MIEQYFNSTGPVTKSFPRNTEERFTFRPSGVGDQGFGSTLSRFTTPTTFQNLPVQIVSLQATQDGLTAVGLVDWPSRHASQDVRYTFMLEGDRLVGRFELLQLPPPPCCGFTFYSSIGTLTLTRSCDVRRPATPDISFQRFKQYDDAWRLQCLNPTVTTSCNVGINYGNSGCILSAIATLFSYGSATGQVEAQPSPVDIRDVLVSLNRFDSAKGEAKLGTDITISIDGYQVRLTRGTLTSLQDVVGELRAGRPVLLGVPTGRSSATLSDMGSRLHYIVAYAYDEDVGFSAGEAMGILIADPGHGSPLFGQAGLPGFVPGYTTIAVPSKFTDHGPVTLYDYFTGVSRQAGSVANMPWGKLDYSWTDENGMGPECRVDVCSKIADWFDRGVFYTKDMHDSPHSIGVTSAVRANLLTRVGFGFPQDIVHRQLLVNSPVGVIVHRTPRLVSPGVGLEPGDVVLRRIDDVPVDSQTEGPDDSAVPAFPHYTLELPPDIADDSLVISVTGVASGDFRIQYVDALGLLRPYAVFSGHIDAGQTLTGLVSLAPMCAVDYNHDGLLNVDDLGDFLTDYFYDTQLPGPGGYAIGCPGFEPPYNLGYKTAYTSDRSGQCSDANPDNLGDFLTDYFVINCASAR